MSGISGDDSNQNGEGRQNQPSNRTVIQPRRPSDAAGRRPPLSQPHEVANSPTTQSPTPRTSPPSPAQTQAPPPSPPPAQGAQSDKTVFAPQKPITHAKPGPTQPQRGPQPTAPPPASSLRQAAKSPTGHPARQGVTFGVPRPVDPRTSLDPSEAGSPTDKSSSGKNGAKATQRPKDAEPFPWLAIGAAVAGVIVVFAGVALWIVLSGDQNRTAATTSDDEAAQIASVDETNSQTDDTTADLPLRSSSDLTTNGASTNTDSVTADPATSTGPLDDPAGASKPAPDGDFDFASLAESTIIALAGDPITIETRSDVRTKEVALDLALLTTPALEITNILAYSMTDTLLLDDGQLMSQLPGSEQSYAFTGATTVDDAPVGYDGEGDETDFTAFSQEGDALDGLTSSGDQGEAPITFSNDVFIEGGGATSRSNSDQLSGQGASQPLTASDTSTLTLSRDDGADPYRIKETVQTVYEDSSLAKELERAGILTSDATAIAEQFSALYGVSSAEERDVLAVLSTPSPGDANQQIAVQISIYRDEAYIGTVALDDNSTYGVGEDPWVGRELFKKTKTQVAAGTYTLLDGVYSAGVRNDLPTAVVGEMILLLSRQEDLKAPIYPGESLTVVYAPQPRDADTGAGKVLYLGLSQRGDKRVDCYVLRPREGTDFECATKTGELKAGDGMFLPVKGRLTSRFGPRKHPILGKVKLHTGVDWAAPTGTPVYAAYPGKVSFAGVAGGYGNRIVLSHAENTSTYYAHLVSFAPGMTPGVEVYQGQQIGSVGTTGRSTGPHLHFEFRKAGVPKDPLTERIDAGSGQVSENRIDALEDMKKLIEDVLERVK